MRVSLLPLLATWLPAALAKLPTPKTTFIKDQYIVSLSSSASLSFDGISESMSIIKEFDSALFRGVVVSLSDPTDVPKIYALAGAEQVYRVRSYPAPKPQVVREVQPSEYDTVDTFSPHVMTGVNVLHDRGYFGKGMVVGIIDTGVDYTHPALGGCFGPGCKIAKGYDFVGDAYNGITDFTIMPGPNPYSNGTCGPHGTHVSGIVAANSTAPGPIFTGVVPQATLGMYRVFGCEDAAGESSTSDPIIIEALIRAYDDGSDVVTLSLGGASGWSESASAVVASNLGALGRVVTIAMGNSGDAGTFYESSPGGGLNVWSIASVDNIGLPSYTAAVSNGPSNFTSFYYFADTPEGFTDLPIYALSNDSSAANTGDACSPLPASTPDLSGCIVVAKRGTCDFVVKYANVAAAGGKYLFIYNNAPGVIFLVDSSTYNITSAFLYATDGAELVTLSGTAARVSAINTTLSSISYASGGKVSDYSSYGPNFEMDQPSAAVSAPGGNIFSTLPGDSYGIYSGTSMATPFVAGSAALYWSINGKSKSGLALRDIFMSTATPVSNYTGDTILESVTHQGGGLLNVSLAVDSTALVSPGYLLLNDTEHLSPVHMITVTNSGKTAITLPITHEAAGTAITFEEGTNIHNPWPVPLSTTAARVFFSTQKLTLGAGESGSFIATFTPPLLDSTLAPLYSGFIKIGSTLTVPYYGLASRLRDLPVLDNSDWFFGVQLPALVDGDGNFVPKGENVTISKSAGDVVEMVFRLVTGTRLLRVDVVNATSTFHATLHKRQVKGTPRLGAFDLVKRSEMVARGGAAVNTTASTAFPGLPFCIQSAPTLGLLDYEFYYPRNDDTDATDYYTETFNGTVYTDTSLDTSTVLSAGSYSILARVLKVTGDPLVDADYESWRSPTIILTD